MCLQTTDATSAPSFALTSSESPTPMTIQTFTGQLFSPFDPKPETINIFDIAHALSLLCRYCGHIQRFYSVAEHSLYCARLVPQEHKLHALLHDASEAYIADISRPVKYMPEMKAYREIEARVEAAIAKKFGIPEEKGPVVSEADSLMLGIEAYELLKPRPQWAVDIVCRQPVHLHWNAVASMSVAKANAPRTIEGAFLYTYFALVGYDKLADETPENQKYFATLSQEE